MTALKRALTSRLSVLEHFADDQEDIPGWQGSQLIGRIKELKLILLILESQSPISDAKDIEEQDGRHC